LVFALALIGRWFALAIGPNVNGAHRWLEFAGAEDRAVGIPETGFRVLAGAFLADKIKRGFPAKRLRWRCSRRALAFFCCSPMSARPRC
jgi:hypothetical protein